MLTESDMNSAKTYYTPLEASVRLSGLIQFEADILKSISNTPWPSAQECARWPVLYLYLCRIQDALLHHELACYKDGMVNENERPLDEQNLSIRHVDLRKWAQNFYPYETHIFLFGGGYVPPAISDRAFQVLRTELEAKEIELARCKESLCQLQTENETLSHRYGELAEMHKLGEAEKEGTGHRRVLSDLNIIDSLRLFLLGERIVGNVRTPFKSGNALINALIKSFPQRPGMSGRTLRSRFAEANRLAREKC
jgi:hypothetical protein